MGLGFGGLVLACGRCRFGAAVVGAMGKRQAAVLALAGGQWPPALLQHLLSTEGPLRPFCIGCDRPLGAWVSPGPGQSSDLHDAEVV